VLRIMGIGSKGLGVNGLEVRGGLRVRDQRDI
jgi:hypothetical protein